MTIQQVSVTPRPDLPLLVVEDMPNLVDGFIAHKVFPIFASAISTAPIPKSMRAGLSRIERLKRAKYGDYPRVQNEVNTAGTFNCEDDGIEVPMDAKDIEVHGGRDRAELIFGAQALRMEALRLEYALASTLFSTVTFDSGYNAAGAAVWDHATDGKPLNDIANAKENVLKRCGMAANTIVMGYGAYTALQKCPQIQTALRSILGINARMDAQLEVSPSTLAMMFGVEQVLIGKAAYNTANEGQTASLSWVWADAYCLVCYVDNTTAGLTAGLGRTFSWDKGLAGVSSAEVSAMPAPFQHFALELIATANNFEVMRARTFVDQLLLNKEAGFLITTL